MKSILIIAFIGCVLMCAVQTLPVNKAANYLLNNIDNHWAKFKQAHNKKYHNSTHEHQRKSVFASNLKVINDHNDGFNNGSETYTLGPTQFADWTYEEYAAFVKASGLNANSVIKNARIASLPRATAPASIDWRNNNGKNYVQTIKNQGQCGSCWTFASVSAMESYVALANGGTVPNLSEQNLVDCALGTNGCNGGNDPSAWNYVKSNGGIATQAKYPYVSGTTGTWNGGCKYTSSMNSGVSVKSYTTIASGDAALTTAIGTIGPITGYIYASSSKFQLYTSGVYSDTACTGKTINHAINLVGYGTLSGKNYYILRNSWGTSWGMSGYMYIARGSNMCSVASYNYYPTVSVSSG